MVVASRVISSTSTAAVLVTEPLEDLVDGRLVETFLADPQHPPQLEQRIVLVATVTVDLLLTSTTDIVEDLQPEPDQVEHVRDHDGVLESVGGRLEPREQIAGDDLGVGSVFSQ